MDNRIREIVRRIDALNGLLAKEYARLSEKYGFYYRRKKVVFLEAIREQNRRFKIPAWKYAIPTSVRHLVSLPFIYMMIIPTVILDAFITVYHLVAFPLYGIPWVKRGEYIVYDRQFLDYLNIIQKVHCLYCSYVNGLFAYAVEIAARTERYWCPVKAARKPTVYHAWYEDFADYGNPEEWKCKFNDRQAFKDKPKPKE